MAHILQGNASRVTAHPLTLRWRFVEGPEGAG